MSEFSRNIKKDELADIVIIAANWIKNNRTLFLTIAGTMLGVVLFAVFFFVRFHNVNSRIAEKLAFAQSMLYQGQPDHGSKLIDEIIAQSPGGAVGIQARLAKVDFLMSQIKYDEAEKLLLPLKDKEKPKTLMPLVLSTLGAVQENTGKYSDAITTYSAFVERFPGHFMTPKIYEALARVYELSNAPDLAKATFEKIIALYPSTGWAQRAQERLAAIVVPTSPAK